MNRKNTAPIWLKKSAGILFWLIVWAVISRIIHKELLVPGPVQTGRALLQMSKEPAFWLAAALSLGRILCGFGLGALIGSLGGILSERCPLFSWLFSPLLHLIRSVPVASFIILALVWIKTPYLPVFISFLMVLPLFWSNIRAGMTQTDRKELEMGQVFGLSKRRIWQWIRLPALAPYFRSSCITGLGFAWKSGVAAEVISRPSASLGNLLQTAKLQLETPDVFALTVVVVLLSLGLEFLLNLAWKEKKHDMP